MQLAGGGRAVQLLLLHLCLQTQSLPTWTAFSGQQQLLPSLWLQPSSALPAWWRQCRPLWHPVTLALCQPATPLQCPCSSGPSWLRRRLQPPRPLWLQWLPALCRQQAQGCQRCAWRPRLLATSCSTSLVAASLLLAWSTLPWRLSQQCQHLPQPLLPPPPLPPPPPPPPPLPFPRTPGRCAQCLPSMSASPLSCTSATRWQCTRTPQRRCQ